MPQEFYQEDEAEAILRIASQNTSIGMPRERLLANAAELGISAEAVEEAELQYRRQKEETELREKFDRHQKREFRAHLTAYVVVTSFLFLLNVLTGIHDAPWFLFPALGWGIGLVFHAIHTYRSTGESQERHFERWAWGHRGNVGGRVSRDELRAMSVHDRHRQVHFGVSAQELRQRD